MHNQCEYKKKIMGAISECVEAFSVVFHPPFGEVSRDYLKKFIAARYFFLSVQYPKNKSEKHKRCENKNNKR